MQHVAGDLSWLHSRAFQISYKCKQTSLVGHTTGITKTVFRILDIDNATSRDSWRPCYTGASEITIRIIPWDTCPLTCPQASLCCLITTVSLMFSISMHPRICVIPDGFQQWKQTSTSVIRKVVTATARLFHKTSMRTPMCVGHGTEFLFF